MRLPVLPIRIRHGVAEHIRRFLLGLGGNVLLEFLPHGASRLVLAGDVAIEELAQGGLILGLQLADLLVRGSGLRGLGQSAMQGIDGLLVDRDLLPVQGRPVASKACDMIVGILLEQGLQGLGSLLLAVSALQRGHLIQRLPVFLGTVEADLLEEGCRLNVGQNVHRAVAVSRAGTDVRAKARLQVSAGLERLRQTLGHARLGVHQQIRPVGHPLGQPAVLVMIAGDDAQVTTHLREVLVRRGPRQAQHAVVRDREEGIATHRLQLVVARLQPDRSHLSNGLLQRHAAKRDMEIPGTGALHGDHQCGIGLHLAQRLPEDALRVPNSIATAAVQLLGQRKLGAGLRFGRHLDRLGCVHEVASLRERLCARGHVVVDVPVLDAVGNVLELLRRQIGSQPASQNLGRASYPQHIHHRAVDEGIAAHRQGQRIDGVVGADTDVAPQRFLGTAAGNLADLRQECAGLQRAQIRRQILLDGIIHVVAGFEHKCLGLHGRGVHIGVGLARGLLNLLQTLTQLHQLQGILRAHEADVGLRRGRLLDAFQLRLDGGGGVLLEGSHGLIGRLTGCHLLLQRILRKTGSLCAPFVVGLEPEGRRWRLDRIKILHGQRIRVAAKQGQLANSGVSAGGGVCDQLLAALPNGVFGPRQKVAVELVPNLLPGAFREVSIVLLRELHVGRVPARLLCHGLNKLALGGPLLLAD